MIQENELITFLIALGGLVFLFANQGKLKRVPGHRWLVSSYCVMFIGWTLTILEGFCLGDLCNLVEHVAYGVSALLLSIWIFRFPPKAWGERP